MKTVLITFRTGIGGGGRVVRRPAPHSIEEVVAEYPGNVVKVKSGDTYQVEPCNNKKATYFAIR